MKARDIMTYVVVNGGVNDGVVDLGGLVVSADQHRALRVLVEETKGAKRLDDKLAVTGPLRGRV